MLRVGVAAEGFWDWGRRGPLDGIRGLATDRALGSETRL